MKLLKKYICLLFFFFSSNTYSQTTFSITIDNNQNSESPRSIIQLEDGSFVIGSGCLINPSWYNSEGDTLWTSQFGGADRDLGWDTAELPDGGLVVVGSTESFGAGDEDIYVVKTDAEGHFQWQKTFGGVNRDVSTNIWVEDSGNIIISGITFDTPTDNAAGILLRLDSEGNELWRRIFPPISTPRPLFS